MKIKKFKTLSVLFLVFMLTACGESDEVAGIGGSGSKVVGTIDAFGSIFVNGIEFDVDNAEIYLDGQVATADDLRLGMVVVVEGVVNTDGKTGVANVVTFNDVVKGPVESIDTSVDGNQKTLRILSTEIRVYKNKTIIDGVTFETLNKNDRLKISGFIVEANVVDATRVEKIENSIDANHVEINGTISELNETSFMVNSIRVEYKGATFLNISAEQLANGSEVDVAGTFDGEILYATSVTFLGHLFEQDVLDAHLQGYIGNFVDHHHFSISGQIVDATRARYGLDPTMLRNGMLVEVEGAIINGVLYATQVDLVEWHDDD